MKLEVLRISSQNDSTSGILFDVVNGKRKFLCYTLEDEQRDVKVWGETRIPAGEYKLSLRKEGGFHSRYQAKYGNMHQGMIHVNDVPGFEFILWHTGNTDEHFIGSSVNAYKKVYPYVAAAISQGDVYVTYIDHDGDVNSSDISDVNSSDITEKLEEISGEIQILSAKIDGRNIE